jgi:hypothetical protein
MEQLPQLNMNSLDNATKRITSWLLLHATVMLTVAAVASKKKATPLSRCLPWVRAGNRYLAELYILESSAEMGGVREERLQTWLVHPARAIHNIQGIVQSHSSSGGSDLSSS